MCISLLQNGALRELRNRSIMILWNQAAIVYEMLTPAPEAQEINFGSLSIFKRMLKMLAMTLRLVLLFLYTKSCSMKKQKQKYSHRRQYPNENHEWQPILIAWKSSLLHIQ